jgi:NAD(P)-dependent dehydrogenase (short-subunit alcohol dehydrogenase family)
VRLERTLTGRAFVVTGAASGIGQAKAELLVEGGALVALVDRDIERLASISGTLGADRVLAFPVDVTSRLRWPRRSTACGPVFIGSIALSPALVCSIRATWPHAGISTWPGSIG